MLCDPDFYESYIKVKRQQIGSRAKKHARKCINPPAYLEFLKPLPEAQAGPPYRNSVDCDYIPRSKKSRRRRNVVLQKMAIDPHCEYCRIELTADKATLDHIIPRSQGGNNKRSNLVLSCYDCNQARGIIPAVEFKMRIMAAMLL